MVMLSGTVLGQAGGWVLFGQLSELLQDGLYLGCRRADFHTELQRHPGRQVDRLVRDKNLAIESGGQRFHRQTSKMQPHLDQSYPKVFSLPTIVAHGKNRSGRASFLGRYS